MVHKQEQFYERGKSLTGYTVTSWTQVTEARGLPSRDFCPKVLELRTGRIFNVYTDSQYAYAILHAHGAIWKERGMLTAENKQLERGLSILKLLEVVQLPRGLSEWARPLAPDGHTVAEEELEALRKHRRAELQAKHGDPGDVAQREAKHREAEMRNSILAQVLDQSARARLSNLALVKPEKTKTVENYLIQMARYGQLSGKVSEQGVIEILEKVNQQTEKKTTVKFNRRKVMDSDEDGD
ncbi:programmed cell death protein 5-like [Phocoena sinus]|nr:programmed cell death protein 5-like [Phocoena sinus]